MFQLPTISQPQPPNLEAEASSAASVEVTQAPALTEVTVQCTTPIIQTTESASYCQS